MTVELNSPYGGTIQIIGSDPVGPVVRMNGHRERPQRGGDNGMIR